MTDEERLIEERADALVILYKKDQVIRAFIDHLLTMLNMTIDNKQGLLALATFLTASMELLERMMKQKDANLN